MPPKKQPKSKALPVKQPPSKATSQVGPGRPKKTAAPSVGAALVDAAAINDSVLDDKKNINAEIWMRHKANVATVLGHPQFEGMKDMSPLGINMEEFASEESSGSQDVFNKDKALVALRLTGQYMCAINMFWLDPLAVTCSEVPMSWTSVTDIQEHHLKNNKTKRLPKELMYEVAVLEQDVNDGTLPPFGSWWRSSPDETFLAVWDDMSTCVTNQDEDMVKACYQASLTASAAFVVVKSKEEAQVRSEQLREDIQQNTTLCRTAIQRVWDINVQHESQGKKSNPAEFAEWYNKRLKLSKNSEPITKSTVDCSFTIWERALQNPMIRDAVLRQERHRQKSVFNSIYRMQGMISKAGSAEQIEWAFLMVEDYFEHGFASVDTFSTRSIEGRLPGANGKGIIDMYIWKKKLLAYLVDQFMPGKTVAKECKAKIREICASIATFRSFCGSPKAPAKDLSWRAGWPESADLLLKLIEDRQTMVTITIT